MWETRRFKFNRTARPAARS